MGAPKLRPEAEIEITPAMVAAGVEELRLSHDTDGNIDSYADVVSDIFRSMMRAKASEIR